MVFVSNISSVVKEANSVAGFGLDPQFAETLSELLSRCRAAGLDFRISQGLRTPQKQAEYYCKWVRRSPADIDAAARKMERDGAPWLASVLKSYRNIPRQQNWLTSQLPGSGWHQWGLAADCYCYRNGHMVENGSDPAYRFYAEQAVRLGLTAGYYFTHQDSGHVQGPSAPGATDVYTWSYIDRVMKERFSDKVSVALPSRAGVARTMPSIETVAIPQSALLAAASPMAATGPFYKDDPILAGTRLEPDFIYKLPASDSTLKRMAQTFNAIGGLVNTLGQRLGIDPVAVLGVWYVESGGRAFTPGKPVLRFENHKFFKYWGVDHEAEFDKHFEFGGHAGVPGSSSKNHKFRDRPSDQWRPVHIPGPDSQDREYEVFALGERLGGREAASLSSSFGGPQIMGFNHAVCGYSSAVALADAFGVDQRWQVLGFFDFCRSNSLIDEIQNRSWVAFGDKYNGDGAVYGPKLKAAFDTKPALLALPKIPNPVTDAVVSVATFKVVKSTRALKKPRRTKAKTKRAVRTRSGAGRSKKRTARSKSPARPKRGRRRAA